MRLNFRAAGALSTFTLTFTLGLLLAALLSVPAPAQAGEATPLAADPALEARVVRITSELRCLVCQNQTIADSHADLAIDLRNQVRDMLKRGDSDQQILDYMTARYGDFVLYRPPLKGTTMLLWFGPVALLIAGLTILVLVLRKRLRMSADQFDPDEDEAAAPQAPETPMASAAAPDAPAARPASTNAVQSTAP